MVQPDGLRAVKGVHSLGWEGWWKRVGGNQDSCRRMSVGYVFMFWGQSAYVYTFWGQSAYVFMVFEARVPMYLYLGWNAYVMLGQRAYMLIKVGEPSFVIVCTPVWCCALRTVKK
jgi:hypothetical protein